MAAYYRYYGHYTGLINFAGYAKIPESLELKISGESLFKDGVAVVIFISSPYGRFFCAGDRGVVFT